MTAPEVPDDVMDTAMGEVHVLTAFGGWSVHETNVIKRIVRETLTKVAPELARQAVAAERERMERAMCSCYPQRVGAHPSRCPAARIARVEPGTDEKCEHEWVDIDTEDVKGRYCRTCGAIAALGSDEVLFDSTPYQQLWEKP